MTGWSKASSGTCRITLTAESGGDAITLAFSIAVFGTGTDLGAVEVVGEFVPALSPQLSFFDIHGNVSWGDSLPGSIELSDDCGGVFMDEYIDVPSGAVHGQWHAPDSPGAGCTVTVTATSLEGLTSSGSFRIDVL